MTEYTKHTPASDWVGDKQDMGGDENVRYKGGKRQKVKAANYKHGQLPRGTGSVGDAGTQTKGFGSQTTK